MDEGHERRDPARRWHAADGLSLGAVDRLHGQKETKVTDLCSELAITRQTLYRHVAPDGTLRKDGLKVVEGGKIRGKKK